MKKYILSTLFLVLISLLHLASSAVWAGDNQWTSIGPEGGGASTLVVDPSTPAILYAVANGGVFKSTNGGESWSPSNVGLSALSVNDLVIAPSNPSTLYLYSESITGGGIFKSINGGKAWNPVNTGLPATVSVSALAIDPSNPATLYAGIRGVYRPAASGLESSGASVFKSTDGGGSWRPIYTMPSNSWSVTISKLVIDPSNPSTLYYMLTYGGVYKSTNSGGNWNLLTTNEVSLLVFDPSHPSTQYAGICSSGNGCGLFKSTDGGGSWTSSNTGLPSHWAFDSLVIAPSNPSTLYAAANGGVFKSTNRGETWSQVNANLTAMYATTLAIDPTNPATLYVATASTSGGYNGLIPSCGEVLKTTNGGVSWNPVNTGLTATSIGSLGIAPSNPSTLYVGTACGLKKSSNGGGSWSLVNSMAGGGGVIVIDPSNTATMYSGQFKSIDGGISWKTMPMPVPAQFVTFAPKVIDPSNPAILYATVSYNNPPHVEVLKSTDKGGSWSPANTGLTSAFNVRALVIDTSNPSTLYTGGGSSNNGSDEEKGGVYKTTDGGESWNPINTGLIVSYPGEGYDVSALAIAPSNPATLYSVVNSMIYRSDDGGGDWNAITSTGLPSGANISSLVIDPSNPATLYAINYHNNGVYKSTDGGASWKPFNNGLTSSIFTAPNSLVIDPSNPATLYMFADVGLFKYTRTPDPNVECVFNWAEGNYPGLFSPSGASSAFWNEYTYRHYPTTNAYLSVSSVDNHVYYQGPDGSLQDEGPLADWLPKAGCKAPPQFDCLFNWAEGNYPGLFSPSGAASAFWDMYTYRHYLATNAYLGVSSADSNVYYQGPDGNLQNEGPTAYWLPQSGCQ